VEVVKAVIVNNNKRTDRRRGHGGRKARGKRQEARGAHLYVFALGNSKFSGFGEV
jgi:hypothetical protein